MTATRSPRPHRRAPDVESAAASPTPADVVRLAESRVADDVELAIALHDAVRDRVRFGFTPRFDAATPDQTLRLGIGHCNPQARLLVDLFRRAGFRARFQPVTITNAVLHGVAATPPLLSHVFTEVDLGDGWRRLDSYIVDPRLRIAATERLRAERRVLGYGCHVDAAPEWDGHSDCFSQIATPDLVVDTHDPVDDIEDFYRSPANRHRVGGIWITTLLAPLRPAAGPLARVLSANVESVRRGPGPVAL